MGNFESTMLQCDIPINRSVIIQRYEMNWGSNKLICLESYLHCVGLISKYADSVSLICLLLTSGDAGELLQSQK